MTSRNAPSLSDFADSLELVWLGGGSDSVLAPRYSHTRTPVHILGGDVIIGVNGVLRLDIEVAGTAGGGGVDWNNGLELRVWGVGTGGGRLGGHCV